VATRDASANIPLAGEHEHVVFAAAGSAAVAGTVLHPGQLMYLGPGRDRVSVAAPDGSRLFLLGGVPLGETLLMWWNLVARTPDEIAAAVADWRAGRFAPVADYDGPPLPPPPLDVGRLSPRP
jgi:quercetin 2,3-dioxygenase